MEEVYGFIVFGKDLKVRNYPFIILQCAVYPIILGYKDILELNNTQ